MFADARGMDCVDKQRRSNAKRIDCMAPVSPRHTVGDPARIAATSRRVEEILIRMAQCRRCKGTGVAHNTLCVRSEISVNGRKGSGTRRKGVGRRRKGVGAFLKGVG